MILLDSSYSCSAQEIEEIVKVKQELDNKMKESNSLREGFLPALQRLERLKDTSSIKGWDGEEAEAVSLTSYKYAKWFLTEVPLGIVAPDPGIDVNGHITLEWRRSDGRLLSLTFDDKGVVHYIFFFKTEKIYGTRPTSLGYSDKLKDFLEDIIKK